MTENTPKNSRLTGVLVRIVLVLTVLLAAMVLLCKPWAPPELPPTEPPTEPAPTQPPEPFMFVIPDPEKARYGSLDFQYLDGKYLSLLSGEGRRGIDVSAHQGQIDWQAVADSGVEFAMIRAAYRGYGTGALMADKYVEQNLKGAAAAGLDVGVYLFSQAITPQEALEEAVFLLNILDGRPLTMPVVFDWEYVSDTARTADVSKETVTECSRVFLSAIRSAGYTPMLYTSPRHTRDHIHLEQLKDFDLWLAFYTDRMRYRFDADIWQYTCTGSVPGIKGDVDINIQFPTGK